VVARARAAVHERQHVVDLEPDLELEERVEDGERRAQGDVTPQAGGAAERFRELRGEPWEVELARPGRPPGDPSVVVGGEHRSHDRLELPRLGGHGGLRHLEITVRLVCASLGTKGRHQSDEDEYAKGALHDCHNAASPSRFTER